MTDERREKLDHLLAKWESGVITVYELKDRIIALFEQPTKREQADAILKAYSQGRFDEFYIMKNGRPIDPTYWDMHHERELQEALEEQPVEQGEHKVERREFNCGYNIDDPELEDRRPPSSGKELGK